MIATVKGETREIPRRAWRLWCDGGVHGGASGQQKNGGLGTRDHKEGTNRRLILTRAIHITPVALSSRTFLPCSVLFVRSRYTSSSSSASSSTFARILPSLYRPPTLTFSTQRHALPTKDYHNTDLRARSKSYLQTLARKPDLRFLRHSQPPHELKLSPLLRQLKHTLFIFTQLRRGGCL